MDTKTNNSTNKPEVPESSLRDAWSYSARWLAPLVLKGDTILDEPVLEVELNGAWVLVDRGLFSSWTGLRRINGEDHHGPVAYLGEDKEYRGHRVCPCPTCQSTVDGPYRHN